MDAVKLLPNKMTAARYRVSTRTTELWLKDKALGFPRPVYIRKRKYFVEAQLDEFDQRRMNQGPPKS